MFSPDECPDPVEIPQTDTSPVKAKTVLPEIRSSVQIGSPDLFTGGDVDVGGRSIDSDDGVSVSEDCSEKLQSFNQVEMGKVLDLGGDSVADF